MNRPILALAVALVACDSGDEAPRVTVAVVVDAQYVVPATTDLGYVVTLDAARLAVSRVELSVAGETHTFWDGLRDLLVGRARAHPGHSAGGEITGELTGPLLIDWFAAEHDLGTATLLAGDYNGANLELIAGSAEQGLAPGDPLIGHGAYIAGSATRDGRGVRFSAVLELPDPAAVIGLPLDLEVDADTTATLGIALATIDPFEHDTAFDGLDFFALAGEGDDVAIGDEANNRLRRNFFAHDYFLVTTTR